MSLEVDVAWRAGGFALEAAFVSSGPLTVLFGRSGAGKTTLVNLVAGLAAPERGRIAVGGRVLVDTARGVCVPAHRRRVGYVFQEHRLFPHLDVRRNLEYGMRARDAARFDEIVALLDLGALLERRAGALSGGEGQRVAIGRALLAGPELLLMDEPLAALDASRKAEVLRYVERLRDSAAAPIVYVTHALSEVARLATDLVVLERGRVVAAGAARELLAREDLVSLGDDDDALAALEARVAAHDDAFGLSELAVEGAGALFVQRVARDAGARVRVQVRARDVMLALEKPSRVSALNVLEARVAGRRERPPSAVEIALDCGAQRIFARITRKSEAELGLSAGARVFAVLKSVSIEPW